jgi:hypothetical protein
VLASGLRDSEDIKMMVHALLSKMAQGGSTSAMGAAGAAAAARWHALIAEQLPVLSSALASAFEKVRNVPNGAARQQASCGRRFAGGGVQGAPCRFASGWSLLCLSLGSAEFLLALTRCTLLRRIFEGSVRHAGRWCAARVAHH